MSVSPLLQTSPALARPLPLLPHLPATEIERDLRAAPGNELEAKFFSLRSSAALSANVWGRFYDRPDLLRCLPGLHGVDWTQGVRVRIEQIVRFGWRGGRHPCLDVRIDTPSHLIGVESKRFEPYDTPKKAVFSERFAREDVWYDGMRGFERAYARLKQQADAFGRLDACQLVKHALALSNEARRMSVAGDCRRVALVYVFADPDRWIPDGDVVDPEARRSHERSLRDFAAMVRGDDVEFVSLTYRDLLNAWDSSENDTLGAHVSALRQAYDFPLEVARADL